MATLAQPAKTSIDWHIEAGCRHIGENRSLLTVANLITSARTVLSLICGSAGILASSESWLLIGLAIYWIGDILDGHYARKLNQETVAGAVYDIVCDRICGAVFFLGWASLHPLSTPVVILFMVEFMVVDLILSLTFFVWPIRSPNYFYQVDQSIFRLNWSKVAKSLNSGVVAVMVIGRVDAYIPVIFISSLLLVKCWSLAKALKLGKGIPASTSCLDNESPETRHS